MARYREALCRVCRREGEKIFLKGDRCFTEKCGFERRKYPPGMHGQKRTKLSDYGVQLREKQKVRNTYGMLERQFRRYFGLAEKTKGATGEVLLQFLERRLDNVVFRLGFAANRRQARQLVGHGFFLVNGKKAAIPSFFVKKNDVIEVAEKGKKHQMIVDNLSKAMHRGKPEWLEVNADAMKGRILDLPSREQIQTPCHEQLIVELYSK